MNRNRLRRLFLLSWIALFYVTGVAHSFAADNLPKKDDPYDEEVLFELFSFEGPLGSASKLIKLLPDAPSFAVDAEGRISAPIPYKVAVLDAQQAQSLVDLLLSVHERPLECPGCKLLSSPRMIAALGISNSLIFPYPLSIDTVPVYIMNAMEFLDGYFNIHVSIEIAYGVCRPEQVTDEQKRVIEMDTMVENHGAILIGGDYVLYSKDEIRVLLLGSCEAQATERAEQGRFAERYVLIRPRSLAQVIRKNKGSQ